jgi:hypothetical protein
MKVVLKGCPRCGGDLVPDRWDLDGREMCCVQCGYEAPFVLVREIASRAGGGSPGATALATASLKRRVA